MHVLIIEDDTVLIDGMKRLLQRHGDGATAVTDIPAARAALPLGRFDALVLDLNLPRGDGLELLRAFRSVIDRVPVLVLTGRDGLADKLSAFELGADDYLTKPFEFLELRARLTAICRRYQERSAGVMVHGGLKLDVEGRSAWYDGERLGLSAREFSILQCLLENRDKVVSRTRLEKSLYGAYGDIASNAIEVHIHNLRKKVPARTIRTVHGLGYTISSSVS